jgi:mono/diheme cytochrome c family protein
MRATFVSAFLSLSAAPALAAGDPDAIKGLLADHCAVCHAIPGFSANPPAAGLAAPAFETIANDPAVYTEERLRAFLKKPHWPMTGFILSPSDTDNLIAYLTTLRHR